MATIFKKISSRPLSRYQQWINEASQKFAVKNPGLLRNRKELLAAARDQILEDGFQFAKGKSRSKKDAPPDTKPKPKRQKLNKELRESRLKKVSKIMRIEFCSKRNGYQLVSKDLWWSVIELKKKKRELEAEKKHLVASHSGITRRSLIKLLKTLTTTKV